MVCLVSGIWHHCVVTWIESTRSPGQRTVVSSAVVAVTPRLKCGTLKRVNSYRTYPVMPMRWDSINSFIKLQPRGINRFTSEARFNLGLFPISNEWPGLVVERWAVRAIQGGLPLWAPHFNPSKGTTNLTMRWSVDTGTNPVILTGI